MRTYPFNYAPLLIGLTLLLNSFFPLLKSPPPPPPQNTVLTEMSR